MSYKIWADRAMEALSRDIPQRSTVQLPQRFSMFSNFIWKDQQGDAIVIAIINIIIIIIDNVIVIINIIIITKTSI